MNEAFSRMDQEVQHINSVTLVGQLVGDPNHKSLESGKLFVNMILRTTERWTRANREAAEYTEWHRVVAWGNTAKCCRDHLKRGNLVCVDGTLMNRFYEKDGETKWVTEILAQSVRGYAVQS